MPELVDRAVIHPDFPFTVDEVTAAWIFHGVGFEEARLLASSISRVMPLQLEPDATDDDATYAPGGIQFVAGFDATINLVADIHANGELLSAAARAAWRDKWLPRPGPRETDLLLDRLAEIGPTWADKRDHFRALLVADAAPAD